MSKELPFLILCMEQYKKNKNLTGKELVKLFDKYSVFEYIVTYYEALHTTGMKYTLNDIDEYIESQKNA